MELAHRFAGADHVLVIGAPLGQTKKIRYQSPVDTIETLTASQTRVLRLGSLRSFSYGAAGE